VHGEKVPQSLVVHVPVRPVPTRFDICERRIFNGTYPVVTHFARSGKRSDIGHKQREKYDTKYCRGEERSEGLGDKMLVTKGGVSSPFEGECAAGGHDIVPLFLSGLE
jgi:hypothetical protein